MSERVGRALISVYSKDGVVDFARELARLGVEIVSSGGTARLLSDHGIAVRQVAELTGFPEMLDGRVKTLHPKIHGGILGIRANPEHRSEMERHGIAPIDLVAVNLYPFRETAARPGATRDEIVEMIDIGGPAMVRAAAKNHADVTVVVDPADYPRVLDEIRSHGAPNTAMRAALAAKAFAHTSSYDEAVHRYLSGAPAPDAQGTRPEELTLRLSKIQELRYGENPHQSAAFYAERDAPAGSIARARQLHGKELSFNNILDFDAALCLVASFDECACVIIKHGNPCGVAIAERPGTAFAKALEVDPLSAFGGVIAFNREVDEPSAAAITEAFYEGVVAPSFSRDALSVLARKKNLRISEVGPLVGLRRSGTDLRRVNGGVLVQDWDDILDRVRACRVVTRRAPTDEEWNALQFAWTVAKFVKSNAIVYAAADRAIGVGAGQMSRVDSARIAVLKARSSLHGAVMASDAFFPFRDGIDAAADAGIVAVVQPGGSVRDDEVVAAADEHGMAMVFTGRRHFRH